MTVSPVTFFHALRTRLSIAGFAVVVLVHELGAEPAFDLGDGIGLEEVTVPAVLSSVSIQPAMS